MRSACLLGVLLATLCGAQTAAAQKRWFSMGLGVSFPVGATSDFTPGASFASFGIESRQFVDRRLSVGIAWSFTELSDEVDEILDFRQLGFADFDNVAGNLSGNQFRTVHSMPLLLTAFFHPVPQPATLMPYIGGGAGITFSERRLNIGLAEFEDDAWAFSMVPQVGLLWWPSEWVGVVADGKFSYSFGDDFDVSFFGINLGVAWRL